MPTTRPPRGCAAAEPRNGASPKVKRPPSAAASQYPPPSGVLAMPTIGEFSFISPVEPKKGAPPKENTPPSEPTIQCGAFGGWVKVTLAVCVIASPSVSSVADNVTLSAALSETPKLADPSASVTALAGETVA